MILSSRGEFIELPKHPLDPPLQADPSHVIGFMISGSYLDYLLDTVPAFTASRLCPKDMYSCLSKNLTTESVCLPRSKVSPRLI